MVLEPTAHWSGTGRKKTIIAVGILAPALPAESEADHAAEAAQGSGAGQEHAIGADRVCGLTAEMTATMAGVILLAIGAVAPVHAPPAQTIGETGVGLGVAIFVIAAAHPVPGPIATIGLGLGYVIATVVEIVTAAVIATAIVTASVVEAKTGRMTRIGVVEAAPPLRLVRLLA